MTRVFISYAHADNQSDDPAKRWLDRMVQHLKPLGFREDDCLTFVTDQAIQLGDDWHAKIQADLQSAGAAVLLVSPAFLASEYIHNSEVPVLLRLAMEQGLKIIPVILRPCLIAETEFKYPDPTHGPEVFTLASLQAAGAPDEALNEMDEGEQDRALLDVAKTLLKYAKSKTVKVKPPPPVGLRIDLSHLPAGAPHFLGREAELAQLDASWESQCRTAIVECIAPGGAGKTALIKYWLDNLRQEGWRGATRVFGWGFYSQGTREDGQVSEDGFLAAALDWFGVECDQALHPAEKGNKLTEAIIAQRALLVLDGLEPLQAPPGPMAGQLRAPGVQTLLTRLASTGHGGLVVVTSREWLSDLDEWVREDGGGAVRRIDLGNLSEVDGARLLHAWGARQAGAASIEPDDEELLQASREVHGHALTLSLLGRYLALAFEGDIRKRNQVDFAEADMEVTGGHCFKVMRAYELWLARSGREGDQLLAALRLLGFFDRPAPLASLQALRNPPAIGGLTEPIIGLNPRQWNMLIGRLKTLGPVLQSSEHTALDAHPLVREYLSHQLKLKQPQAWREGHRRIYEQLKTSVPRRPEGLLGLQPLYLAVAHGCNAGLWQAVCDDVYRDRILRGTGDAGFYSSKKLGALGVNLSAVTESPDRVPGRGVRSNQEVIDSDKVWQPISVRLRAS
jgi:hypothetical protein